MGRIGFRTIEEIKEAERLLLAAGAEIEGIFTHFATADEADDRKFQAQYQFFKEVLAALETLPPIVHASNSEMCIRDRGYTILVILFENQIQTTSASPYRIYVTYFVSSIYNLKAVL